MQLYLQKVMNLSKQKAFHILKAILNVLKTLKLKRKLLLDGIKLNLKKIFLIMRIHVRFSMKNIIILYIHILLKMITKIIFLERQKMVKKNL